MRANYESHHLRFLSMSTLIAVASVILLGCAQNVLAQGQWATNANNINNTNSGNVGIGPNSPSFPLQVNTVTGGQFEQMYPGSTNTGTFAVVNQTNAHGLYFGIGSSGNAWLQVARHDGSTATYNLILQSAGGKVGIGIINPQVKLDVLGDMNASGTITGGNIAAKYQDVAEWVQSTEKLSTGTVVVLDSTKSNQVVASTVSYDTRVAGVISEQPGIALGEKGESKVLVATTGRVRVKVDATHAPIHIGDLLVTSDVPGVAMKSDPVNLGGVQIHRPGTLIGKALEPLEKGSGMILVLLSLQ